MLTILDSIQSLLSLSFMVLRVRNEKKTLTRYKIVSCTLLGHGFWKNEIQKYEVKLVLSSPKSQENSRIEDNEFIWDFGTVVSPHKMFFGYYLYQLYYTFTIKSWQYFSILLGKIIFLKFHPICNSKTVNFQFRNSQI